MIGCSKYDIDVLVIGESEENAGGLAAIECEGVGRLCNDIDPAG
jgi:hypothetical protein